MEQHPIVIESRMVPGRALFQCLFIFCLAVQLSIAAGPPILVIGSTSNAFTGYYSEILGAEGLNAFDYSDIRFVSGADLKCSLVLPGQMSLTSAQVTMLKNWVTEGCNLISMRPDKELVRFPGQVNASSTLPRGYLLANPAGVSDGHSKPNPSVPRNRGLYKLNGATAFAALCSTGTTAHRSQPLL